MPLFRQHFFFFLFILFLSDKSVWSQSLASVGSWAYQLDAIQADKIASNKTFDLIVMDYSADGTAEKAFSRDEILQIKNSGKIAVAYISIGEAEEYRFYWKSDWKKNPPAWLGPENPNWPGNYKVRFWNAEWQKIVFAYVDTILSRGFDGIYCDIIDAYYYWREENPEQPLADSLMVQFLASIRQHISENHSGSFFIIPQNGEAIIEEDHVSDNLRQVYWNTIDGIGVEDVFCPGDADEDNAFQPDTDRLVYLQKFVAHGKPVFSVEYLRNTDLIGRYVEAARTRHFVPYVSTRNLNHLFNGIRTAVRRCESPYPQNFALFQNYPNPFNPITRIEFEVPALQEGKKYGADLAVFDASGRKIATLTKGSFYPGEYNFTWNGRTTSGVRVPSGIYFYRLKIGSFSQIRRMLLLR